MTRIVESFILNSSFLFLILILEEKDRETLAGTQSSATDSLTLWLIGDNSKPLSSHPLEDGRYALLAGNCGEAAAEKLGWETIRAGNRKRFEREDKSLLH